MKKTLFVAAAGLLLFASCKKDYTCTCDRLTVYDNGNPSSTSTTETTFKDVKKDMVEDKYECFSDEYSYSYEEFVSFDPITFDPIYETVNVTVTNDCTISK